jgi:hypothetical protein
MTIRDNIERLQWEIAQATAAINQLRASCPHSNHQILESDEVRAAVGYKTVECLDCQFRWREVV